MGIRIGVDLGGTKIALIAIQPDGSTAHEARIATPLGDYTRTVGALCTLIENAEATLGMHCSVGVAHPGSESPADGKIRNANSTCLNGRALRRDLRVLLQRDVRLANDADCFALSESTDGAGAGFDSVFGVILGTGVGGGLVLNAKPLSGANGIAGEWGHNRLDVRFVDGDDFLPDCYCGRSSCVETWLSGPALRADHLRVTGQNLDPKAIATAAIAGDVLASATLLRYEGRLAFALAQVINLVDPAVIVLGGGLSNIKRLYGNVPSLWAKHIFSDVVRTRLLPPRHGDASGVRGAAWLWPAGSP